MTSKVVLRVKGGALPPRSYVFFGQTMCRIGRSSDCPLQVPAPEVSRHHCLLVVDPPRVFIRDLGSRNGTFVNDHSIGRREPHGDPEALLSDSLPSHELHAGDQVRIGTTVFDIEIIQTDEPDSSVCRREMVTG